jgi:predicted DsbA family dithiol-disulfide isomerase
MHAALFENSPVLDYEHTLAYARMTNLDLQRFAADVENRVYLPRVQADVAGALQSGVHGTPTFFINGVRHRGGYDVESL